MPLRWLSQFVISKDMRGENFLLEQGTILEGRYEIKRKLGEGGFSYVYLAYDREKRRNCAVKEITKLHNKLACYMSYKEVTLIWKLQYPYFPEIEEIIEKEHVIYIVMEYLEGETLDKILKRLGPQSQTDVVKWSRDLCFLLEYLHNCNPPVIYRDMKPANIMLQTSGNLRLIDFGAIWEGEVYPEQNRISYGTGIWPSLDAKEDINLGTKGYAAPEQFEEKGKIDVRTDIYGLGVTMYQLLTGKDPCQFPSEQYKLRYWNWRLSKKLEKIVWKCTRLNPEERYRSCKELREDLEIFAKSKKM